MADLSPDNRAKLDGIVSQMTTNGESDDYIQGVVNDFKTKYASSIPAKGQRLAPPGTSLRRQQNAEVAAPGYSGPQPGERMAKEMTNAIPLAGGAVGGTLAAPLGPVGAVTGAGLGAGAGSLVKQGINKLIGQPGPNTPSGVAVQAGQDALTQGALPEAMGLGASAVAEPVAAAAGGAAKGAWQAAKSPVRLPFLHGRLPITVPAPVATGVGGAMMGHYLAGPEGKMIGGAIGAATPIVQGAIRGGKQGIKDMMAARAAADAAAGAGAAPGSAPGSAPPDADAINRMMAPPPAPPQGFPEEDFPGNHGGQEGTPMPDQAPQGHPPFAKDTHKSPATVARQLRGVGTMAEQPPPPSPQGDLPWVPGYGHLSQDAIKRILDRMGGQ